MVEKERDGVFYQKARLTSLPAVMTLEERVALGQLLCDGAEGYFVNALKDRKLVRTKVKIEGKTETLYVKAFDHEEDYSKSDSNIPAGNGVHGFVAGYCVARKQWFIGQVSPDNNLYFVADRQVLDIPGKATLNQRLREEEAKILEILKAKRKEK